MTGEAPEDAPADDVPSAGYQPDSLEERVAALEDTFGDLASGMTQEIDQLSAAVQELASNGTPAGALEGGDPARPWAARATTEDWAELAQWVDWLAATYDLQPSKAVLSCWPAHGGAVHELAALHSAWVSAAKRDASDDPADAMAMWHDRALRPTLARLREDYQLKLCADRHQAPRPSRLTDQALLTASTSDTSPAGSDDSSNLNS